MREFVERAIHSCLTQDYANVDVVVVDDGSTDGTVEILETISRRSLRVNLVRKKPTNLADSLDVGIMHARGEFIARLDADDYSTSDRIRKQHSILIGNRAIGLVGSGCKVVHHQGHRKPVVHRWPYGHAPLFSRLERMQTFFPHSSALFRKDLYYAVGGYRKHFAKSQDWDLWLRMGRAAEIRCASEPLSVISIHAGQISATATKPSQRQYALAATVSQILRDRGYRDPVLDGESEFNEFLTWILEKTKGTEFEPRQSLRLTAERFRRSAFLEKMQILLNRKIAVEIMLHLRQKYLGTTLAFDLANQWSKLEVGRHFKNE